MTDNQTSIATTVDWASLSGVILDGGCELKEPLDVRENAAKIRVRILGSGGRMGTAYFLVLEPRDAAEQLEVWETLRDVPHPNLSRPLSVGKRPVGSAEAIYFVLGDPDERLAGVVPERPLEWEEAAEVLHSAEKGLAHLHAYGLTHGSVSPDTVQAMGYSILLDTESVCRLGKKPHIEWSKPRYFAPESKGVNLTTQADVWCLGATLFEVLSQEPWGTPGAELEKGLPLGAVIKRCLEKDPATRCTLKEAPAFEEAPPLPPPPARVVEPVAAAAPIVAPEIAKPETTAAAPAVEKPAPTIIPPPPRPTPTPRPAPTLRPSGSRLPQPLAPPPHTAPRQVTKEDMALVPIAKRHRKVQKRAPVGARIKTLDGPTSEAPEETSGSSVAAVAARTLALGKQSNLVRNLVAGVALALIFAAAVWLIIIPKLQSPVEPITTGESAQTASPSAPQTGLSDSSATPVPKGVAVSDTLPIPPQSSVPAPVIPAPKSDLPAAQSTHRSYFRVVLSDPEPEEAAKLRLEQLNQKHPDLFLRILQPKDDVQSFLVVAGGALTRTEADALRQRIKQKGIGSVRVEEVFQ